jgi:hypothetical protein
MRPAAVAALVLVTALMAACSAPVVLPTPRSGNLNQPSLVWQIRDDTGATRTVPGNSTVRATSGDSVEVTLWGKDPTGVQEVSLYETLAASCQGSGRSIPLSPVDKPQDKELSPDSNGNLLTGWPLFLTVNFDMFCPAGYTMSSDVVLGLHGSVSSSARTTNEFLAFTVT